MVYGYEKFTGSDLEVEKPHVAPDTDLSKSDIEWPKDIDKYYLWDS